MKYNRVLLKLSGEALSGDKGTGFDEATCIQVAGQIKELVEDGCQVAIVIGGGNFWRGRTSETIMRNQADQIGMLATVMNCLYMSEICRYVGMKTQVYTPFVCGAFTELFSRDKVETGFEKGQVAFLAGGTGQGSLLCRRHRTSVFFYRYCDSTSCHRDWCGCDPCCQIH